MRPQITSQIDDLVARLAMEDDRRIEARATAGIDRYPPTGGRDGDAGPEPRRRHGPVHHRVPSDVSEYVIPDFRPGIDSCSIELRTSAVEVIHWQGPGGTVLCVDDGREQVVIAFLGLDEPPIDDITMAYPRRGDGALVRFEARPLATSDLVSAAVVATPFAGPSGTGALAEFWGFDVASEVVEVMRCPEAAGEARVTVLPTPDGRDAMIIVDGQATAILRGAPSASRRNVRVVVSPDL